MAKQSINIGSIANDGTGTTLRDGGDLINDNFNEIYTELGDGSSLDLAGKSITFTGKTISGSSNTLSNIANSSLTNSEITFAGDSGSDSAALGETYTIAGGTSISTTATSNTLTINLGSINATTTSITNVPTPSAAGDPASKSYVDTIAAAGIHYHTAVRVESPSNLNAAYDNGTSGVGATLTNSGAQAAIEIDGVALSTSDRVLVYNQTNAAHNGVYTVTTVGDGVSNWVLTRATDADSYGASDSDALGEGDAFFVQEGDTGAGELYVMSTSGTITFGTTNINFTVIAETAIYSAGDGLTLTGTSFSTNVDDSSIEINADTLRVKALGITNAMLAGSIENAKLSNSTITINGSAISLGGSTTTDVVDDTTPQLGGNLDLNSNDITGSGDINISGNIDIGDSNELRFGASDDLKIYHDGSNSYIVDNGTGDLYLQANDNIYLQQVGGAETFASFTKNGAVTIYFDNSIKLATTTNGVHIQNGGLGVGTDAGATDGEIRATGDITAFYTSDQSLKENVKNIENPLDKINQINGVTFDWTDDYIESQGGNDDYFMRKNDVGVIAQEVEKVLPEVIGTRANGTKAVKYDRIVALLIEGIKDLNKQVSDLKTEIEELKK